MRCDATSAGAQKRTRARTVREQTIHGPRTDRATHPGPIETGVSKGVVMRLRGSGRPSRYSRRAGIRARRGVRHAEAPIPDLVFSTLDPILASCGLGEVSACSNRVAFHFIAKTLIIIDVRGAAESSGRGAAEPSLRLTATCDHSCHAGAHLACVAVTLSSEEQAPSSSPSKPSRPCQTVGLS